jgi:hypothetical protein
MDNAVRRSTSIPTLEPSHPRRRHPHYDRIHPDSRVSQLNEDDLIGYNTQQEQNQHQHQPQAQPDRRASNESQHHSSSASNHHALEPIPSPLYQTVIPAFNPNHYDLSTTNICFCFPVTFRSPLNKWRQRRRSAQELRARDEELRNEHARLKHIETEFRGDLPPYEEARKNGIHVRNEGIEQPRTAAVPQFGLNQAGLVNGK